MEKQRNPWAALWAIVIGFFMILVDSTIVTVANPSIQKGLDADTNSVIWVTSAYLLAYAVPLLVTGRFGDRFGPKNLYLLGLSIFTLASLWCGLADELPGSGIAQLIVARAVQGFGASLMTPQTMAIITRTFPPNRRGTAMSLWGATAGVAMLVGPLVGGLLVDGPGWQWIFFVNVPIGVVAFVLAAALVPKLTRHPHTIDWLGVLLSAAGMFLLVFGLQEGNSYDWNGWVWAMIAAGVLLLALFVVWQWRNRREPLIPLRLFADRNFSIANVIITTVGFAITSMFIPIVYFLQVVQGLTPTESALLMIPTSVLVLGLSPFVGRLSDRVHPRLLVVPGVVLTAAAIVLYAVVVQPGLSPLWMLIPAAVLGLGNAFMWAPISSTATRNLPPQAAGAGAGVYNATRQVGSVLGSAAIAALMVARITADLPPLPPGVTIGQESGGGLVLPEALHEGFASAMRESLFLPAAVLLVGAVLAFFLARPRHLSPQDQAAPEPQERAAASAPLS